jgi:hypothetical protein
VRLFVPIPLSFVRLFEYRVGINKLESFEILFGLSFFIFSSIFVLLLDLRL